MAIKQKIIVYIKEFLKSEQNSKLTENFKSYANR